MILDFLRRFYRSLLVIGLARIWSIPAWVASWRNFRSLMLLFLEDISTIEVDLPFSAWPLVEFFRCWLICVTMLIWFLLCCSRSSSISLYISSLLKTSLRMLIRLITCCKVWHVSHSTPREASVTLIASKFWAFSTRMMTLAISMFESSFGWFVWLFWRALSLFFFELTSSNDSIWTVEDLDPAG